MQKILPALAFAAAVLAGPAAAAHDAGDHERGFSTNRYSVTHAFLRGGEAVRCEEVELIFENVTLTFHCHVPMNDRVGMSGLFRVGAGSPRVQVAQASEATAPAATYEGVGTVIATVPRMGRLIVDHEEIEGFMGAMEMSYPVVPPALLEGLSPGDRIGFTIDAQAAKITGVKVLQKAN